MVDSPEVPHAHSSHTGHRWLDIVLGVSAIFVSMVSLMIALEHGRTMERMADANTRMVEANSWPFVQFDTHNVDEHGNANVRFVLTNEGIGPARIETFELWWDGKPMSSPAALMRSCCVTTPTESAQANTAIISVGIAAPQILRAGEHVDFYEISENSGNAALWSKLNTERDKVTTRVCYCSVFGECWVQLGGVRLLRENPAAVVHPDRVSACPVPEIPYQVSARSSN